MTELNHLREEIDDIDEKIVSLIEKRMTLSQKVGEYKDANHLPILDKKREDDIVQSRVNMLADPAFAESVEEIFKLVMRYSRRYQRKDRRV
jgi:monofunctional chorismate mutase